MDPEVAHSKTEINLDLMCLECINNDALNMPGQYYRKGYTDTIAISEYHEKCQKWGLPVYPNFMCFGNKDMHTWMVRLFLYGGWIEKSLGSKKKEAIVKYLSVILNLMVPLEILDNVYYLDFLSCSWPIWFESGVKTSHCHTSSRKEGSSRTRYPGKASLQHC
ncbi:hypothetical protein CAEBREN_24149 [Caenorhabditis brenneri]|uniref:Uncharacterized protein n=1 Tax=Caenorhabditis brenneri TaxID=135651 RepID=G0NGN5_CAEBE|nr:hypothetical protein CAEBREN_24149 [Caenorhabditis brenneri]